MYVNGVLQADTDTNTFGIISSGTNLEIGDRATSPYSYFNGQIDEVRIWNVARTQAEINQYKGVTLTLPQAGLVSYYQFDGNANDSAGSNNSTISGAIWTGSGAPVTYEPTTQVLRCI